MNNSKRLVACLGFALLCLVDSLSYAGSDTVVTVDTQVGYQVMEGFGSSVRVWDDPHVANQPQSAIGERTRSAVLEKLYRELRLTRARLVYDGGIEVANDNGNSSAFAWKGFNFSGKRNDAFVDYVQRASAYGLIVAFPSPLRPEPWMREEDPEEYVEWVLAILLRWRALGKELQYFSILNEPSNGGSAHNGAWSPAWFVAVSRSLGKRMQAEGLETRLVLPDDINACAALPIAEAVLRDAEARSSVGALAFHTYGGDAGCINRLAALARRHKLALWMTEHSHGGDYPAAFAWAKEIHELITRYDITAVDHMWGFFGHWEKRATLIALGFHDGRQTDMQLLPNYFVTGHYSRFVYPGDTRVRAVSSPRDVLASAYHGPGRLSVVLINDSGNSRDVAVEFKGMMPSRFEAVLTDIDRNWAPLAFASSGNVVELRMPPRSLVSLGGVE